MTMDCLTFDDLSAYLIAYGVKRVENRSWALPGPFPRRIYLHNSKDKALDLPWLGEPDLPRGLYKKYHAWRHNGGPIADWMPAFFDLVKAERAFYGVEDLGDVALDEKAWPKHKEPWFCKPSMIIGWMDIDKVTHGDFEELGPFAMPGQFHWHIAAAGRLDKDIGPVPGKLKIWRYEA